MPYWNGYHLKRNFPEYILLKIPNRTLPVAFLASKEAEGGHKRIPRFSDIWRQVNP